MSVVIYPAVVTGDAVRGYSARFPDLSSVEASAPDGVELLSRSRVRLLESLNALEAKGAEWPVATAVEQLRSALGPPDSVLMLVDVQVEDTPVRVNISIGERLLRKIDEAAGAKDMSRSGFIAAACRDRLGAGGGRPETIPDKLYEEVAAVGRRVDEVLGPESTIGRALSDLDQRAGGQLRRFVEGLTGPGNKRERRPEARPASAGGTKTGSTGMGAGAEQADATAQRGPGRS